MNKRQICLIAMAGFSGCGTVTCLIGLIPGATMVNEFSISHLGRNAVFLYPVLLLMAVDALKRAPLSRDNIYCAILVILCDHLMDDLSVTRSLVPGLCVIAAFLAWLEMKRSNEPTIWQLREQES